MEEKEMLEIMAGMEEANRNHFSTINGPKCHFTPMKYEESDDESWFECKHCGHTKSVGMLNRPR